MFSMYGKYFKKRGNDKINNIVLGDIARLEINDVDRLRVANKITS